MRTKKLLAAGALAAASTVLMAGCGGSPSSDQSGPVDLTWSMWIGSTEDQTTWQGVGSSVTEKYPDIKVTLQGAPYADYWTKLATQLSSSNPQCIVTVQGQRLNQFAGALTPLDDLIKANNFDTSGFDTVAIDAMKQGDKTYALPYDTGPAVMYYNADLFDKAGAAEPTAGWTSQDYEAAGAKLKAIGKPILANTPEDFAVITLAHAYNGAAPIGADGTIDASQPAFQQALEWQANLAKQGYATQGSGADNTAEDNAFITGQAATFVGGPWNSQDLASKAKFKLGVTTLPAGPGGGQSYSSGSGFAISKGCKNPDAAFKAITQMTSDQELTKLASSGRALVARTAGQPSWYTASDKVAQVTETFTAAQKTAVPYPGSAKSAQFGQLLAQYGAPAVNGTEPVGDVLSKINSELGN